jgi:hypothetical protein
MKTEFLLAAQDELQEAIAYYNSQLAGLGLNLQMKLHTRWNASSIILGPGRHCLRGCDVVR